MYTHAHTHIYIHTHMHTYTHTCIHTCIHAHACTCIHTHIQTHTYIHTYTHACMHTYIHTQTRWGWRDGSAVKSTWYCFKAPGLRYQHPRGGLPTILNFSSFFGLFGYQIHMCCTNIHVVKHSCTQNKINK